MPMTHRLAALLSVLTVLPALPTVAQSSAPTTSTSTAVASGSFAVQLAPQPTDAGPAVGRMSIDKQFKGDLVASSKGEMLAFRSAVEGSAGYVAIENVTGTLHGRRGSFALQHTGTMDRGAPALTVTVVPDSGTEELAGLTGRMDIVIEAGKHSYRFEYSLPEAR